MKNGEYKNCLTCHNQFWVQANLIKIGKGKYCSKPCASKGQIGSIPWWVKQGKEPLANKGKTRFKKNDPRRPLIEAKRLANMPRRETHPRWLGDEVGYGALHDWVYKELGRPMCCELCGEDDLKRKYHWANKSGLYLRRHHDWLRLCVPCHKAYDLKKGISRMGAIR